jgi:hypothetical protein
MNNVIVSSTICSVIKHVVSNVEKRALISQTIVSMKKTIVFIVLPIILESEMIVFMLKTTGTRKTDVFRVRQSFVNLKLVFSGARSPLALSTRENH